jgi:hypothetical protein
MRVRPEIFALRVIVWSVLAGIMVTMLVVGGPWICFTLGFGIGLGRLWERASARKVRKAPTIARPIPFTGPDDPRQWRENHVVR